MPRKMRKVRALCCCLPLTFPLGDILDIFKKFLFHHVAPFGHYLRVPYEQVQIITGRSNVLPQQQAFEIYDFWEKNRDSTLSDEEHQRTLQDALQHCGHGRAAENLVHSPGSRSNTITNGGKCTKIIILLL